MNFCLRLKSDKLKVALLFQKRALCLPWAHIQVNPICLGGMFVVVFSEYIWQATIAFTQPTRVWSQLIS